MSTIKDVECRFIVRVPQNQYRPDLHLIKEKVHYEDGTTAKRLRWKKDFKRDFYITNLDKRNHQQKKESEYLNNLTKFSSTQSTLAESIANVLDKPFGKQSLKDICNSPYVYGVEIPSEVVLKKEEMDKNKGTKTPFDVMSFDIETDMINGHQEPIIITAVYEKKLYLCVIKGFIKGVADTEARYKAACHRYITDYVCLDGYEFIYEEAEDSVSLIKKSFEWIHGQMPDFLAIWNMDFDIPKIIECLERNNINPADVLSDPSVPPPARYCRYKQGLKKKTKSNGQEVPIDPQDQWHKLFLTASFYVIDSMCVYRLIRLANSKLPSYSLDSILELELGVRKLKFKEADKYVKDQWHIFMQRNYKIEYMAYAVFDSLSMILLDNKILDLKIKIPEMAKFSSFDRVNSRPKVIGDKLHYKYLSKKQVICSVGNEAMAWDNTNEDDIDDDDEEDELEDRSILSTGERTRETILSLKGWICTLRSHLVAPGLSLLEETKDISTFLRAFVYDSDCVSAYPRAGSILNISKSTTKRELISIQGIPEVTFRAQNMNLSSGYVNAIEYSQEMFNLPSMFDLEDLI